MKQSLLFFLLCCVMGTTKTQDWCGNHAPLASLQVAEAPARSKTIVTIPVVVHVVWHTEAEMISEAQVRSQIVVLNEDFRAANTDLEDVFFFYTSRIADTEIEFELATTDPDGNPHDGIIIKQTEFSGIGTSFEGGRRRVCYDDLGGSTAWPTACYLNIWVADLGIDGWAGIGIFPGQVGVEYPAEEDGIFIQPNRFGTIGTASEPYHLGRTTTHEVGHYLNLLHPWGAETPPANCSAAICCVDPQYDDFVDDTGKQILTFSGQCPTGSSTSCVANNPHNAQNFMGYADDACALMFTEGQKIRMWETLMTSRASLLEKCTTSTVYVSPQDDAWLDYAYWQGNQLRFGVLEASTHWRLYNAAGQLVYDMGRLPGGDFAFGLTAATAGLYVLVGGNDGQYQSTKLIRY